MNSTELDTAYTALAEVIGRCEQQGSDKTQLMLATLSLSLMTKLESPDEALTLIAQAEKLASR